MTMPSASIPPFDSTGNLPDGVHPTTEAAMETRYVTAIQGSRTRPTIFAGFKRFRSDAVEQGITGTQWVNGSFVTNKPDPADVDVVTFCDYAQLNSLSDAAQAFLLQYLNGRELTKAKYSTHAFLVPCCDSGHAYFATFEAARVYWRKWFGTPRPTPNPPRPDAPGQPKGMLEIPLGDPSRAPQIDRAKRSLP